MTLNRRIWRIMKENKARYISVAALIFLGSFTFIAATGIARNLSFLVSDFAESGRQEDLSFSTGEPLTDIAELEKQINADIEAYLSCDTELTEGRSLRLMSPGEKVNIPAVKEGRGLEKQGDILLDPYFCTAQKVNIGDSLQINGKSFTVAGEMALPNYVYVIKNIFDVMPTEGFGIGIVAAGEFVDFPNNQTVYAVRFHNRDNLNEQIAALHGRLTADGHDLSDWVDAMNNKRIRMPWASITGMQAMSIPIPCVMFLLCCLIISIMIWRMIRADGVVIGTLYAQGYRRKELLRHYIRLPLTLAAIGGITGVLLAIPCVAPAVNGMISYYNVPATRISVSFINILIGILMPVVFLGVAGLAVIRRELRKTAADLMKGDEQVTRANFLERYIKLDRFRFNTKFALREQIRSIPRLLFLLLGVTGASVLMLFGFTINHSMNAVFSGDGMDMYQFAWEYSFKQMQQGEVPAESEPFNAIRCYPEGHESMEFYVTGIKADSTAIKLTDTAGQRLPANQVNITAPLASRLKLKKGDSISFVNKLDNQIYTLTIAGIAETYAGQFVYMPLDRFNEMTGVSADSYSGLFSQIQQPSIDEKLLAGVKDISSLSSGMDELALPMTGMVIFMAVIAGFMGVIIIFLVTSLMIDESRITISLFKVFGYQRKEVNALILNSSTIAVIIGFVIGVPLVVISAQAIYGYLGDMINMVLPIIISPWNIIICFLLIMLSYQISKVFCARKINKITMSEALKAGTE